MEKYWKRRQDALAGEKSDKSSDSTVNDKPNHHQKKSLRALTGFDEHRKTLLAQGLEGGWMAELNRYLGEVSAEVSADLDVIQYWQVRSCFLHIASLD